MFEMLRPNPSFFFVQGEIELISMMKPKAPSEMEAGMLEYIEDIIGSNRFIEPIRHFSAKVEDTNEIRIEKVCHGSSISFLPVKANLSSVQLIDIFKRHEIFECLLLTKEQFGTKFDKRFICIVGFNLT